MRSNVDVAVRPLTRLATVQKGDSKEIIAAVEYVLHTATDQSIEAHGCDRMLSGSPLRYAAIGNPASAFMQLAMSRSSAPSRCWQSAIPHRRSCSSPCHGVPHPR